MQTHSIVFCLQDKSLKVAHLSILVLHRPHCPENVTHLQSSVYAILFVRNTVSFLWGVLLPSFKCSFSSVPTLLLSLVQLLVCLSPVLVCKLHEGQGWVSPFFLGGGCLFYPRVGTIFHLYLLIVIKSYH